VVELAVDRLGVLRNTVVPPQSPAWSPDPKRVRPRLAGDP
jgi:hypothetical protein